jgi:hypothetical protein
MNDDDFQGRGPAPRGASGLDWLLAVLFGTCLALALVSWAEEAEPAFTAEVSK